MQNLRICLTFALVIVLASCGWHLRGLEPLSQDLQVLHLNAKEPDGEFARALRRSLRAIDVDLLDSKANAPIVLEVSPVQNKRRTISTTELGKAAEYQLTTRIEYRVLNAAGDIILGPESLQTEKVYLFDRQNVASTYEEEQLLHDEMRRDLVQQLIRRYRTASLAGR